MTMKIVIGYLGVGVVFLAVMLIRMQIEKRRNGPSVSDMLSEMRAKESLKARFVEDLLLPVLTGLMIVIVWPAVMVFVIKESLSDAKRRKQEEAAKFRVTEDDLIEKLSIEDIESRERVEDPLGAVSDAPFGHLNSAWESFKDDLSVDSELWSFEAVREDYEGEPHSTLGYASRKGDETVSYFKTG